MSKLFGPVLQQGYVVPDIQAAMQHWLARGVGPFFIEKLENFPAIIDGQDAVVNVTAAFAYSGAQQIEVIQQDDKTQSIYREFLAETPNGGLQHLAVWVDDIQEKLDELRAAGHNFQVRQAYGDQHAYVDNADSPGVMIQLMARGDAIEDLFAIVRRGAETWDGINRPIRKINWSTGRPVEESD